MSKKQWRFVVPGKRLGEYTEVDSLKDAVKIFKEQWPDGNGTAVIEAYWFPGMPENIEIYLNPRFSPTFHILAEVWKKNEKSGIWYLYKTEVWHQ